MPFLRKNITSSGGLDERENQCGGQKEESGRRGRVRKAQSTHFMISPGLDYVTQPHRSSHLRSRLLPENSTLVIRYHITVYLPVIKSVR